MDITSHTKVIARLHKKASPRGLNIYNPFFQDSGINAVYLLFHNPDPAPLINGIRSLNLIGAITAGFESDPNLPPLLDDLDPSAQAVGKVGFIKNLDGRLRGYYQGGLGLFNTITNLCPIKNKRLVLVGSGTLVASLLGVLSKSVTKPTSISIYNRTLAHATAVKSKYSIVTSVHTLTELAKAEGDILVNASDIGGSVKDYVFPKNLVTNFQAIVDVTFEEENTSLIQQAKQHSIPHATGWDFFSHQGLVVLHELFQTHFDFQLFSKYVRAGLSRDVT